MWLLRVIFMRGGCWRGFDLKEWVGEGWNLSVN